MVVALAGLRLAARRPGVPAIGEDGERERARDGIVHLIRDRTLGLVVGAVFVSLLFMTASATAEVVFIKDDLGAFVVARRIALAGGVPVLAVLVGLLLYRRNAASAAARSKNTAIRAT